MELDLGTPSEEDTVWLGWSEALRLPSVERDLVRRSALTLRAPGDEGGFRLCTAWLIDACLKVGRRADAEELFESFVRLTGPTGLLPEEYDPVAERSLGNHPQAYSHPGLIRCARLLDG